MGKTRVYAFLKMLLLLQKYNFNVRRTESRGKRYIWRFHQFGHEAVDEKESLTYELLWEWITDYVKKLPVLEPQPAELTNFVPDLSLLNS